MPQQPPQKEGLIRHSTVILHSPSTYSSLSSFFVLCDENFWLWFWSSLVFWSWPCLCEWQMLWWTISLHLPKSLRCTGRQARLWVYMYSKCDPLLRHDSSFWWAVSGRSERWSLPQTGTDISWHQGPGQWSKWPLSESFFSVVIMFECKN